MDWGADRQVLLRLYRSSIISKLDYCSLFYCSAQKSYLQKLEAVQNQALRLCLAAYQSSLIDRPHVEENETPMHLRQEMLAL